MRGVPNKKIQFYGDMDIDVVLQFPIHGTLPPRFAGDVREAETFQMVVAVFSDHTGASTCSPREEGGFDVEMGERIAKGRLQSALYRDTPYVGPKFAELHTHSAVTYDLAKQLRMPIQFCDMDPIDE